MTKPLSDLEKAKALESLKMLYGDAPYNKWSNFVSGDAYFASSLEKKYGMTIKELGVLCGYGNRNINPDVVGEVASVLNGHSNAAVYYNRENDSVEIIHPSIDNLSLKKTIVNEPVNEPKEELTAEPKSEPTNDTKTTNDPKDATVEAAVETKAEPADETTKPPEVKQIALTIKTETKTEPTATAPEATAPAAPAHSGSENVRLFREELNVVKAFKDAHDAIQIAEAHLKSYFGPLVREVTTEEEGKAILERIPECVSKSFFEEYLAFKKTSFQ